MFYFAAGEKIEKEESKLLGEILKRSNNNYSEYGINTQQLAEGKSDLTYEEVEFVIKDFPSMQILSKRLKTDLKSSESYTFKSSVVQHTYILITTIWRSNSMYRLIWSITTS